MPWACAATTARCTRARSCSLGQRQPQMRDIAKVAGRPDLHDVDTRSGAIRLGFGNCKTHLIRHFLDTPAALRKSESDQRVVAIESRKLGLNGLMAYT